MEEGPKMLIGAPFLGLVVDGLLVLLHYPGRLNLIVIDHFSVGVNYWKCHLQALKLIRRGMCGTTRWGVLRRGVLTKTTGSWPLGKLLQVRGGSAT
jgi:hypothetical protein